MLIAGPRGTALLGDRPTGIDQRVEGAEQLAAAPAGGAHLGEGVGEGRPARGLHVEHGEGHVVERAVAEGHARIVSEQVFGPR